MLQNKKSKWMFPLNIQLFAEGGNANGDDNNSQGAQGNTSSKDNSQSGSNNVDHEKLADIISKRLSVTEDSVLKGYFKDQGLSQEEAQEAIKQYKETQANTRKQSVERQSQLENENAQLKKQILNTQLDSKITAFANEKKVKAEHMPYLLKLVERNGMASDKGEISDDKVKSAIEQVLKDFPAFVTKDESHGTGFQQIGGSGSSGKTGSDADAALRAAFGLKAK